MRLGIVVTLAAAVVTLASGCSDDDSSSKHADHRASSGADSSNGDKAFNGAPKVKSPLDTTAYQKDPCKVLSSEQLKTAGLTGPGTSVSTPEPSCLWKVPNASGNTGGTLTITFLTNALPHEGIGSLYGSHAYQAFKVFEPFDIQGYPAVVYDLRKDDRNKGQCKLAVGVTDEIAYEVKNSLDAPSTPGYADSCSGAKKAAEAALTTMKSGT